MIRRLRKKAGETLVETMAALLIASVSVSLITGAVIAAARVNSRAGEELKEAAFNASASELVSEEYELSLSAGGSEKSAKLKLYSLKNEDGESVYYYYEP